MAAFTLPHTTEIPDAVRRLPVVPWERVEGFVGQLTHDIRNGLNALELQLTFLGEISTDPEAVDEIKRLRATVGNVTRQLQTLRTATGAVRPYPLEYPAKEFFDDLRERLAKLHPGSDERVVWDVALEADTRLLVDPELTLGAMLEVLSNGLHFAADERLAIRVEVSALKDELTVAIREQQPVQPVIAPEDWGRTPLLTTRRGAYGLGLFRVRRSIEAQSGTMKVEYSAETQIFTTTVTLPGGPEKQP